ncbi:MAG: glycosyltransferase family 39 protein, partial [Anaerolineales bacterium]
MMMDLENNTPEANDKHPIGDEPSVLDWLKSLFSGHPIPIPESTGTEPEVRRASIQKKVADKDEQTSTRSVIRASQFRLPLALLFALMAQFGLEQESASITLSILLYVLAAALIGWAAWSRDFPLIHRPLLPVHMHAVRVRLPFLVISIFSFLMTFLTAGDNRFDAFTFYPWIIGMVSIVYAFWEGDLPHVLFWKKLRSWQAMGGISTRITTWSILLLLAFGLSVFFRAYRISGVPAEMVSDHAEKLLDVIDVLNGQNSIFFPRNTGREALQFYMAVATYKLFGTGISHLTLKIGTVAAGILTLPFIYLLGKEVADRKTGLFAMILAGIAYWPNVISRVGLRFPLYPLFVAPAMYYLVRGIRRRSLNDFLLMGFFVGASLHGYSPARVIPILMTVGVLLYLLHRDAKGQRLQVLSYLVAAGLVALVVLTPLARVAIDRPDELIYRMATRMGTTEQPLPGSALMIFLQNVW